MQESYSCLQDINQQLEIYKNPSFTSPENTHPFQPRISILVDRYQSLRWIDLSNNDTKMNSYIGIANQSGDLVLQLIEKLETYITSVLFKLSILAEIHGRDKIAYATSLLNKLCEDYEVQSEDYSYLMPNFEDQSRVIRASFFEW